MPETLSITGKRASATVFCSNLIIVERTIAFLTAYGPTQEIRAFAQLLTSEGSRLHEPNDTLIASFDIFSLQLLRLDNGYSAMYITPPLSGGLLIGDSKAECFATYSRLLDQQHFVLRDWYRKLFDLAEPIEPRIGAKTCFRTVKDVAQEVRQLIGRKHCRFPEPTAHFVLKQEPAPTTPVH